MHSALLLLCLFGVTTSMPTLGHQEDNTRVDSGFCLSSNKVWRFQQFIFYTN